MLVTEWSRAAVPAFVTGSAFVALLASPLLWHAVSVIPHSQKGRDARWRASTHSITCVLGLIACVRQPWLTTPKLMWEGWPHQQHDRELLALYAVFCGFTLGSLPEVRRSNELKTMAAHHALTLVLVVSSFATGCLRIGALVMLTNDFVDVWFEAAKLSRYSGKEKASKRFLCVFVLAWAVLRQAFAFRLARSAYWDGWEAFVDNAETPYVHLWGVLFGLLASLWVLHAYWFVFLFHKAVSVCSGAAQSSR